MLRVWEILIIERWRGERLESPGQMDNQNVGRESLL